MSHEYINQDSHSADRIVGLSVHGAASDGRCEIGRYGRRGQTEDKAWDPRQPRVAAFAPTTTTAFGDPSRRRENDVDGGSSSRLSSVDSQAKRAVIPFRPNTTSHL